MYLLSRSIWSSMSEMTSPIVDLRAEKSPSTVIVLPCELRIGSPLESTAVELVRGG